MKECKELWVVWIEYIVFYFWGSYEYILIMLDDFIENYSRKF